MNWCSWNAQRIFLSIGIHNFSHFKFKSVSPSTISFISDITIILNWLTNYSSKFIGILLVKNQRLSLSWFIQNDKPLILISGCDLLQASSIVVPHFYSSYFEINPFISFILQKIYGNFLISICFKKSTCGRWGDDEL